MLQPKIEYILVYKNTSNRIEFNCHVIGQKEYPEKDEKIGCWLDCWYGSDKHMMSVQKLWELIPDGFVLIDPDILVKKKSFDYAEHGITPQEMEIIEEVAAGLSNREIADKLFLSEGTVRNYLSNVLRKLDLRDRTNLAIFYYQNR